MRKGGGSRQAPDLPQPYRLAGHDTGMIYSEGGRFFGYGLHLLKGKPDFTYNFLGLKRTKWEGPALSPGKHKIELDFKYDGLGAETLAYNNVSGIVCRRSKIPTIRCRSDRCKPAALAPGFTDVRPGRVKTPSGAAAQDPVRAGS